jgi:predicted ATP-grasp superfamily ATP-dependent carboligase
MAGNRSPTILVTDANRGTAVTIIRSLGRAGRDVVAADSNPGAIGFSSRYTSHKFVYPDPKTEPERFIETLLENVKRYSIDLILPVTDDVLQPLINASELFAGICTLGVPEKKAYEIVTDKFQTLELADKLGIPTPVTRRVETLEDLDKISDQLEFPLVVKPESSVKLCSDGEYRSFSVCYAEDMASLRKTMVELGGNIAVLLQEYTAGAGCGIDIVANKGECLCVFEHQRLAEVPITGGASAWRESVDPDPVLVSHAKRLVAELEWTGPIMVEFKVGKKISLMEINGRVWGSMPLASAAGVDFPGIWAGIYLGEQDPVAGQCNYPLGVRTYNLELMSTWIINVMLGRTRYPYLPHPRRWEAFKGLFAVFSGGSHSDLISTDDPVPAQLQRRGLLGRLSSKVRSELSPGKSGHRPLQK